MLAITGQLRPLNLFVYAVLLEKSHFLEVDKHA